MAVGAEEAGGRHEVLARRDLPLDVVLHLLAAGVLDDEGLGGAGLLLVHLVLGHVLVELGLRHGEAGVLLKLAEEALLEHADVVLRVLGRLVNTVDEADALLGEEVDDGLVVRVGGLLQRDALVLALLLLLLEELLDDEAVELLRRHIGEHLLEAVGLAAGGRVEAAQVEDAEVERLLGLEAGAGLGEHLGVDGVDDGLEEAGVDGLDEQHLLLLRLLE